MKKLALALVAASASLTAGSAIAADLPARTYSKAPPPAPIAVANWTGCYISGGGGYGLSNSENTTYVDPPLVVPRTLFSPTQDHGGKGWFGTVGGGCDYQFSGGALPWQIVVGAFGDYDFADIKGDITTAPGVMGGGWTGTGREKLSDQWSVGGRIGVLITPQLLTYFSGGYTEAKFDQVNLTAFAPGAPPFFNPAFNGYYGSQTYKGWFLGSGYEYQLSFLPGLYWKTEYRFSEFDTGTNFVRNAATNALTGFSVDTDKYVHTVRSTLVWRFNFGGAGVVARY